jgi:hypothetical protein
MRVEISVGAVLLAAGEEEHGSHCRHDAEAQPERFQINGSLFHGYF